MTGADDRPGMRLLSFKPIGKSGLAGFASIELAIGLRLFDLPVFGGGQSGPWVRLPRKPSLDRNRGGSGLAPTRSRLSRPSPNGKTAIPPIAFRPPSWNWCWPPILILSSRRHELLDPANARHRAFRTDDRETAGLPRTGPRPGCRLPRRNNACRGGNLAMRLGGASDDLVDADLDCIEALALPICICRRPAPNSDALETALASALSRAGRHLLELCRSAR